MTAHIENTHEFEFSLADGGHLFVRDWPLADRANARDGVVIMHGLGEHCGRYAHVARFFNALGFVVRTYDHRGHGQSSGARGSLPDGEALLRDARALINDFSDQLHAPPLLFGHSMGGLFAARFATAGLAPLRGLILSSPALAVRLSTSEAFLLKLATALFPSVGVSNGLKPRYLTHDAEVVAAYRNDSLVHTRVSARLVNSMQAAMQYAHDHAPQLQLPVLLQVAEDDHLVDPMGSRQFAARLPETSSKAIFYAGFYHEIYNELDATRVFDDLRTWLDEQGLMPVLSNATLTSLRS